MVCRTIDVSEMSSSPVSAPEEPVGSKVFGGVVYECVRCGTRVTADELAQLPEIKCICGYRVLKKARPPVVKQVKAL
jgi:DNA-directed RNA polymerase subunit P